LVTKHTPRIFISATSSDLKSIRLTTREALLNIGCMPIEQTDFPPDYRGVSEFLTKEIANCDAVIHIAGKCYGAEPNPETLPLDQIRRSFTQLEYDTAIRLKKKLYVFVCGDEFPYDACQPEDEQKIALQSAHRSALLSTDTKFEIANESSDIGSKIRLIRLELEEITKQIHSERNRQFVAWGIVGCVLLALLAIVFNSKRLIDDTQRDVVATKNSTNQLLVNSDEMLERSARIKDVDTNVRNLVTSDVFEKVAKSANADPQRVKQLVLQAESRNIPLYQYSSDLAQDQRVRDAYVLSRFVAESTLEMVPPDFQSASESFLSAAKFNSDLADREAEVKTKAAMYRESETLSVRGMDALQAIPGGYWKENLDRFLALATQRFVAAKKRATISDPVEAREIASSALIQLDNLLSHQVLQAVSDPKNSVVASGKPTIYGDLYCELICSKASLLLLQSRYLTIDRATSNLRLAIEETSRSMGLCAENDSDTLANAFVVSAEAHIELGWHVPEQASIELFEEGIETYKKIFASGKSGDSETTSVDVKCAISQLKSRVTKLSDKEITELKLAYRDSDSSQVKQKLWFTILDISAYNGLGNDFGGVLKDGFLKGYLSGTTGSPSQVVNFANYIVNYEPVWLDSDELFRFHTKVKKVRVRWPVNLCTSVHGRLSLALANLKVSFAKDASKYMWRIGMAAEAEDILAELRKHFENPSHSTSVARMKVIHADTLLLTEGPDLDLETILNSIRLLRDAVAIVDSDDNPRLWIEIMGRIGWRYRCISTFKPKRTLVKELGNVNWNRNLEFQIERAINYHESLPDRGKERNIEHGKLDKAATGYFWDTTYYVMRPQHKVQVYKDLVECYSAMARWDDNIDENRRLVSSAIRCAIFAAMYELTIGKAQFDDESGEETYPTLTEMAGGMSDNSFKQFLDEVTKSAEIDRLRNSFLSIYIRETEVSEAEWFDNQVKEAKVQFYNFKDKPRTEKSDDQ